MSVHVSHKEPLLRIAKRASIPAWKAWLIRILSVVLALLPGPPQMMVRNLLYTAVTRAKQRVVMVGSEGVLRRMVENDKTAHRYSALGERLQALDRLRAIGEGEP